jgi:hypothetical protein
MNKWTTWYDSLPEHTKEYLKNQPIWHDRDLYKFCTITFTIGLIIGALLAWHY